MLYLLALLDVYPGWWEMARVRRWPF